MTAVEDRLRAALRARAGQVTGLGPPPPLPVGNRTGMRPGLRKALVVALAAVLATVVLVLPHFLSRDDAPGPADAPPSPSLPDGSESPAPTGSTPMPIAPQER
ncbi:hypothetical protein ACF1DY_17690 [Streptomyces albus]